MFANELIGKKAIRKTPAILGPIDDPLDFGQGNTKTTMRYDYSYTDSPIQILAATESHIIYKSLEKWFKDDPPRILDCRWCDDNWTDYDELLKLAGPEMQSLLAREE